MIQTYFKDLDNIINGFNNSELILIGSRPSVGKTCFAFNLVDNILLNTDCKIEYITFENSKEIITSKLKENKHLICHKHLNKRLYINSTGTYNINDFERYIGLLVDKKNIDIIFIDYVQLFKYIEIRENSYERFAEVSRTLKRLTVEYNIPIVVLSQLNRSLESRSNKRPILTDLRDTGTLEDDADKVIFLYRDDEYRQQVELEKSRKAWEEGKEYHSSYTPSRIIDMELIVAKNRHGRKGTATILFHKVECYYENNKAPMFEVVYEDDTNESDKDIILPKI